MAPNGQRFASYSSRNLYQLLNQQFWADLTFLFKSGFSQTFSMTSPETLYTKSTINELSFLMVTHTTYFSRPFDRYEFLNSGFSVGQTGIEVLGQVFGPQDGLNFPGSTYNI
jgi:hypothetical protein